MKKKIYLVHFQNLDDLVLTKNVTVAAFSLEEARIKAIYQINDESFKVIDVEQFEQFEQFVS